MEHRKKEVYNVSPRTGRPKAENPKNVNIKVRFDEQLNQRLIEYCQKHNISKTEAIRQGVHLLLATDK